MTVNVNESLPTLCKSMNLGKDSVHRVAVVNEKNVVVGIVSQFKILSFIYSKLKDSNLLKEKKIENNALKPAICCSKDSVVIECFEMLHSEVCILIFTMFIKWVIKRTQQKISGMPIVDKDGVLIGSFSASDIKVFCFSDVIYL